MVICLISALCSGRIWWSLGKDDRLFTAYCWIALDCLCLHVQHCPPHHGRVNLCNFLRDVGLELVEGGRARAVDL